MARMIIQDNLWFTPGVGSSGGHNYASPSTDDDWMPFEPLLGRTGSDDVEAKQQELQWLLRYTGRRGSGLVVTQEWQWPYRPPHQPSRIDRNLQQTWLPIFRRHGGRARWCIFWDTNTVFQRYKKPGQPPPPPPDDFAKPKVMDTWIGDLEYIKKYFPDKKYWRIGGRPVLYVFQVHALENFELAYKEAKKRGIYVLADVFGGPKPKPPDQVPADGVTGFHLVIPGLPRDPAKAIRVDASYRKLLRQELDRWKGEPGFVPAASLQYDDWACWNFAHLLAATPQDVRQLLRLLASYKAPSIMLGTANCWPEGSSILPTKKKGKRFHLGKIGHYHFKALELIHDELFPGVGTYTGPRLRVNRKTRTVVAKDLDVLAEVEVTPKSALKEDRVRANFDRKLVFRSSCTVSCRNLDGKKATASL